MSGLHTTRNGKGKKLISVSTPALFDAMGIIFALERKVKITEFDFSGILERDLTKKEKQKMKKYGRTTPLEVIKIILFTKAQWLKERFDIKIKLRKEIKITDSGEYWGCIWNDSSHNGKEKKLKKLKTKNKK